MTDLTPASDGALRLTVYDHAAGTDMLVSSGSGRWFVYAPQGAIKLVSDNTEVTIAADDGAFLTEAWRLEGMATAWIFEVAPAASPFLGSVEVVRSQVLRPALPCLFRADRIESPPGAVTPRHGHRGPGIRRLVAGRLLAEVGETVERIEAGQAWFESGSEMVVGTNIGTTNAAFVRVMLLPMELEGGKSSFVPQDEREAAKPRAVKSRLYGELTIAGADMESTE